MAIATAAVTFDIADQLGNDFDPRRTKIWITTNIPGDTIIDKAGNKIRLGSGNVTLNADGTGSMLVWVPGADANPSSWQTTVHVDYPDRNKTKGRETKSFGPFTITANADLADLVAEMPVQPDYLATVLATVQDMIDDATDGTGPALAAIGQRVNGYTDHGNVSGEVTFNGPTASHRFDATGPTTVTLAGFGEGGVATLICFSGAENVTVNNAGDVELVDATAWSAEYARGTWVSGGGGGTPAVPDATPPTAVTGLSATGGEGQVTFNWTSATDAESTVGYRYRVWLTSGGATGEYITRSSVGPVTVTGLAAGAYTVQIYAYSSGGASATASATATVTAALVTLLTDTFTGSHGSNITGRAADSGQVWQGSTSSATINLNRLSLSTGTVYINHGAQAREVTATAIMASSGGELNVRAWADTSGAGGVMGQIKQNGQVYVEGIDTTFNVTGGTNSYTPTGYLTLAVGDTAEMRMTYDGTLFAMWVNGVKVIEGPAVAAMTGTRTSLVGPAMIDNLIVKGV